MAYVDKPIMDGITLLEEADNHFLLQNPSGVQAPLPKKGLSEDYLNQIRGLPKGGASGSWEKPGVMQNILDTAGAVANNIFNPPPSEAPPLVQMSYEQLAARTPQPPAPPVQPQPIQQQAMPIPQGDPMGNYQNLFDTQSKGIKDTAAAQIAGQQQAMDAAEKLQQDMEKTKKFYAEKRAQLDEEQKALQKDYSDGKIDPNRFWNQKTGFSGGLSKVLAMVGLFLGGQAQVRGGSNPAQQMLQHAIDNDIDAQKAEMGKKQNLMRMNMEKYGDLQQAEQATRLDTMNMFNAQLQQMAAKTNSQVVKSNAAIAQAELGMKMEVLKDQIAQKQALNNINRALIAGSGVNDSTIGMLPKEVQEKAVKIINPLDPKDQGRWMMGKTPEATKEVEKLQGTTKQLIGLIDEMKAARKRNEGDILGATSIIPWTNKSEEYNQLHGAAMEELRSLSSGARLNEGTIKYLSEIIPKPGSPKTSEEELDRAKNILVEKLSGEVSGRVLNAPNLKPMAFKGLEVKP